MTCRHCQPDAREGVSVEEMDKRCDTCVFYMPDPLRKYVGACSFGRTWIYAYKYPSVTFDFPDCENWTDNIEEAREWL